MAINSLLAALPSPVEFDVGQAGASIIPHASTNNTPESYQTAFGGLLGSILTFVMVIAVVLVLLYLVWGAIEWITSGGDKGKLEKARNRIFQAIIGIIVLSGTLAILMMVQQFLGVCIITIGGKCTPSSTNSPTEIVRCVTVDTCTLNRGVNIGACTPAVTGHVKCRWRGIP